MVRIVLSPIAKVDLKEIVEYIKRNSFKYARLEKNKILNTIEKLSFQPFLGKTFVKANDGSVREIIFQNYRIIYQIISEQHIEILTIHHHSRSFSRNPAIGEDE